MNSYNEAVKNCRVTAEITVNLSMEDVDDIMSAALDDGITYWCSRVEVVGGYPGECASEQIARGGVLNLYDAESSDVYQLDLAKLLTGIKIFLEEGNHVAVDDNLLNVADIDANDADCIVQFALFGEVLYG